MTALSELNLPHENPSPVFRSPQEARNAYPVIESVEQTFADQLTSKIRYNRFRTDETIEEWVEILGPDVLFLTHPVESARITHDLAATEEAYGKPFGAKLKNQLYTAPWIHDFGEIMIGNEGIGDISFDKKTDDHEHEEIKIFRKVMDALADPSDSQTLNDVYATIVMDRHSPLGQAFNAVERIGYLETAVRAYLGHGGRRIERWQELSANVLQNNMATLLSLRQKYPYADVVLRENRHVVSAILQEAEGKQIPFDSEGTLSYDPVRLKAAREAWNNSDLS